MLEHSVEETIEHRRDAAHVFDYGAALESSVSWWRDITQMKIPKP